MAKTTGAVLLRGMILPSLCRLLLLLNVIIVVVNTIILHFPSRIVILIKGVRE